MKLRDGRLWPGLAWAALLGWMGLIFLLSHQPSLPDLPGGWLDLFAKKLAHFITYALLLSLWWAALRLTWPTFTRPLALALLLTVLYAVFDEWHQTFVPGRSGRAADVLIDTAGALTALLLLRLRKPVLVFHFIGKLNL